MDPTVRYAMEQKLRKQRQRLWEEALGADTELQSLAGNRESELVEASQLEQMAGLMTRLDRRTKEEIEEIDAALMRLADGRYGMCLGCGRRIAIERLQALPATRYCVRCARQHSSEPGSAVKAPPR